MKRKFALAVSVMVALLVVGTVLVLTSQSTQAASPLAPHASALRISQAYGGGGSATAGTAYKYDYVELFNAGSSSIDIGGWSVQYGSATGNFASLATNLYTFTTGTTIAPGKYLLIQLGTAGTAGSNLPTPDFTTTNLLMSGLSGKVALANISASLGCGAIATPCSLPDTRIADLVGYGNITTTVEITAVNYPTALDSTRGAVRKSNGCQDTDNNFNDFTVVVSPTLIPRNSASPANLCLAPVAEADLGIAKSGPATALADETITYTISLSNTGTTTATGTLITDMLPAEVNFVTYTTALGGSFMQNGQSLVWTVGDVPTTTANATIEVRVGVPATLLNGVSFTNTVTASTTASETVTTNNSASARTYIGAPDLVVVKSGPASVNAGNPVAYTLTYSNAGTINATNVVVVDRLPAGLSYSADSAGGVRSGNAITWNLGGLNAGAASSILLTATALYAGDWVNTAMISGDPIDSNPANNTSSVTTTVKGADPYVLKSGPTMVFGGERITYTLTYGNSGNVTATATLTDQLPSGFAVSNIAFDNSGLPFVNGAAARTWTVNINPNSTLSFTLALTVPTTITSGTRITNTLTISAIETGDDPINNAAAAASTVYQIVSIATARAGVTGQTFALEGQVIVVPATYSTDEWELQDASGAIALFYTPAPVVALGDRIRLVAPLATPYYAQQQLGTPVFFNNLGPGTPVAPKPFTTGAIAAGTVQGWLGVISGTLSGLGTCSTNYHIFVNDGSGAADIFINTYSNPAINPCGRGFANGDWVRVTGFSTVFSPTYELRPRMASDFVQYPRVLNTGPVSGTINVPVTANITATFNMTVTNVNTTTFTLAGPTGSVTGIVSYTAGIAIFDPAANLSYNTRYTATLNTNLAATGGSLMLPSAYVWSFTTEPSPSDLSTSTKVASATGRIKPGDLVTYTISLINTGGITTIVSVKDVLGSYYTVATALDFTQSPTGTLTGGATVPGNQTVTLRFVARVTSLTQLPLGVTVVLSNTATVDDGLNPTRNLVSANPPTVQVQGLYLPLIRR